MFMLLVLTVVLGVSLGDTLPSDRPKFTKSGKLVIGERIVGGQAISITDAPYQVALEEDGYLYCGGSIVNKHQVVSAGHCVKGSRPSDIKIRAGSTQLETGGSLHQVKSINLHEKYNYNLDYDVSVLTVEEEFVFDETCRPIPLTRSEPRKNNPVTVTGWGAEHEGAWTLPAQLHQVEVPIISRRDCQRSYGLLSITSRMICAGRKEGGLDSCQGDSGGPLVFNGSLAGIVSWGTGCARPNYPGVYTNVNNLKSWIQKHLNSYE